MSKQATIREALLRQVDQQVTAQLIQGAVTAVDTASRLIDIRLSDDLILHDVRMQAEPEQSTGFVLIPALGSTVTVGFIDKDTYPVLLQVSEVDSVEMIVQGTTFNVDSTGILLAANSQNLNDLLTEIIGLLRSTLNGISALTVTCSAPGAPSTPPINLASFTSNLAQLPAVEQKLNSLLKSS